MGQEGLKESPGCLDGGVTRGILTPVLAVLRWWEWKDGGETLGEPGLGSLLTAKLKPGSQHSHSQPPGASAL